MFVQGKGLQAVNVNWEIVMLLEKALLRITRQQRHGIEKPLSKEMLAGSII